MLCVWVRRPSGSTKGNSLLYRALLRDADLNKCIKFLDEKQYGLRVGPDLLERMHNEWLWQRDEDTRIPWFKLVVVGGRELAFVYHHAVTDGMGGTVFHR